jgi:hypothetical protein
LAGSSGTRSAGLVDIEPLRVSAHVEGLQAEVVKQRLARIRMCVD